MQLIAGRLFNANNKAIPQLLFFDQKGFKLSSGEQVFPDCLSNDPRKPVQLDLGDGRLFISAVPLNLEIWQCFQPQKNKKFPLWLKVSLATLLSIALLFFLSMWLIAQLPRFIPESWSEKLANTVEKQLLTLHILEESQLSLTEQATIRSLLLPLEEGIEYKFYSFAAGANAFALPHKRIIITDQIVKFFQGKEDLLVAVVAHELGHIHYQHPLKQLAKDSLFTLVFSLGDENIADYAKFIVLNYYSRDAEEQADRYAVDFLNSHQRAGEELLGQALKELRAEYAHASELPQWLSTHPSFEKRLKNLKLTD